MPDRAGGVFAVLAGAGALLWPAFVNGYPLLFSDTGAFMFQALGPFMVWDKPWIYGPALVATSLRLTLWLPALVQGVLVSWVLWRVQGVFGCMRWWRHLALCAVLAIGSTAPWFTSLLMPDIFAGLTVLCLFLLAAGTLPPAQRLAIGALATFAIASHLSHLVVAAACLAALALLRQRVPVLPLVAAIGLLAMTNIVGFGRVAVSPFGAVFALARLTADGPATTYLRAACPAAGYAMCAWVDRLPMRSDAFLWDPHGPVWSYPGGPIALAPEAGRIVSATIRAEPLAVLQAAERNTWRQFALVRLGDTLGPDWLQATVGLRLHTSYPAAEQARFEASRQMHDRLRPIAEVLEPLHYALLIAGVLGSVAVLILRPDRQRTLAALVLVGVLANAVVTGALSGPHERYQARIAWLLLLPPLVCRAMPDRKGFTVGESERIGDALHFAGRSLMDLGTAQSAIAALKLKSTLDAAYQSYFAGHDDKHRSASSAYGWNHASATPDDPQGYYQKKGTASVVTGTEMKSVWGKAPTPQPVFSTVETFNDLTPDDEKTLLWLSVNSAGSYYKTPGDTKFAFCSAIPGAYAGFAFSGGGASFPKKPTSCASMVIVIAAGGSSTQIVTTFPALPSYVSGLAALT